MSEQTIKTYKTKGYKHEGVSGPTDDMRLDEKVGMITPQVMKENNSPVEKIRGTPVKISATGNGIDGDKPVDSLKGKGKSAGNVGSNNVSHA